MRTILVSITSSILLVTLAACGSDSGSGVDGSKPVVTMTASEKQTFCEWVVAQQGGAGHTTDCGNGVTVTTQTVAECVAGFADLIATCPATVAQGEACASASAAAPCSFGGEACAPLFACIPE